MADSPYCCERMQADFEQVCDQHPDRSDCPDNLVERYSDGTYVLLIHDGGGSGVEIAFCPWCGTKLSGSAPARRRIDVGA